jgi:Rrf2 family protein
VHISAKADYAMRALLVIARSGHDRPIKGATIADEQDMPPKYVENILVDLRRAGLVASQRGSEGGFRLARPATEITVADVVRATDGPLAEVRGLRPEEVSYEGAAEHLQSIWLAVRISLRNVLETVTLDQVATGKLPKNIAKMAENPEAMLTRPTRPGVNPSASTTQPPPRLRS